MTKGFKSYQEGGRDPHDTIAERAMMGDNFGGSMAKREALGVPDQLVKGDISIDLQPEPTCKCHRRTVEGYIVSVDVVKH